MILAMMFAVKYKKGYFLKMKMLFYVGFGMQLFGMASVGLCLFSGLSVGDYGKIELAQLVIGSFVFYVGNYLKTRASAS